MLVGLGWLVAAAAAAGQPASSQPCLAAAPGADLDALIARLPEGGSACLAPGDYAGPVHIDRRVSLRGPRSAVVHSRGEGSTVRITAAGAALRGITVDGSGARFDLLDAAVRIGADDVVVEGVAIRDALFGILAEQASRIRLLDNEIQGPAGKVLGMRGDAIRIWEVRDSELSGNRVFDGRDFVVWYSSGNRIAGNRVERGRYGLHLMYSHDNVLEGNRLVRNVVGVFLMYSRGVRVRSNLVADSGGAAGMGLGAKESGALRVVGNAFIANTVGVYLDTSPLDIANANVFERNAFRFSDAAVVFHGRAAGNRFEANRFVDNATPVRVHGRGDARDAVWLGNEYGDYAGYDFDRDGTGDIPYELRSLSGSLLARQPALAFFRGSAALGLVDFASRALPLFRTPTLIVDPAPAMRLPDPPVLGRKG